MKLKKAIKKKLLENIPSPTYSTWDAFGFISVPVSDWKVDPYNYYGNVKKKDITDYGIKIIFDKFGESEESRNLVNDLNDAVEDGEVNDRYEVDEFIKKYENDRSNN